MLNNGAFQKQASGNYPALCGKRCAIWLYSCGARHAL
uniref:Uncharacterized protein n=1 Tax=Salmonella phage PMBT35 TaxID=3137287 RepID=A0AAU8BUX5_9VIRU